MKKQLIQITIIALTIMSCNKITNKTKEGINKSGEVVGKTATEFFEGVSNGVDKTLECEIVLSQNLQSKGLKTGAYTIENGTNSNNNKLILYLIFNNDFNNSVTAKAFNKSNLEIGRS